MTAENAKIFKFQELALFNYSDYRLIRSFKAAGSAEFNFSPELVEQMSGPSFFPIETEVSTITTEGILNIGEYGSQVLEALMDASVTDNSVSSGLVTVPRNIGTGTLFNSASASTSINAVALGATPRAGQYRIEVTGASEITVNAIYSPSLARADYSDELNGIVEVVTLTAGTTSNLSIGVDVTAAATLTLNMGDSFIIDVFESGHDSYTAEIGQENLVIPKVKLACLSRNMSDGRWGALFLHNCIFPGLNLKFIDEFSANEITGKLIFDPVERSVGRWTAFTKTAS